MPRCDVIVETPVVRTPRVKVLEGMFDLGEASHSRKRISVAIPIEDKKWNIGLIYGASGTGKSLIAKNAFGKHLHVENKWDEDKSVVDSFAADIPVKEIVAIMSSVGFSSVPSWLKPYRVLSNGEKFRVDMARLVAEARDVVVVDEFTSVVDRQVATVGCASIQKTIRLKDKQFVAVSCHSDIIDWLMPDWTLCTDTGEFQWRSLRQRPRIVVDISRTPAATWDQFKEHHYLNTSLNHASNCWVGRVGGHPVFFAAVLSQPHPISPSWRFHRVVVKPDYQGVGIGIACTDFIASMYACQKNVTITTSNPAMIHAYNRSRKWAMTSKPALGKWHQKVAGRTTKMSAISRGLNRTAAVKRMICSFRYVGDKDVAAAEALIRK